jgi:hypothetical protein
MLDQLYSKVSQTTAKMTVKVSNPSQLYSKKLFLCFKDATLAVVGVGEKVSVKRDVPLGGMGKGKTQSSHH